MSVRTSEPTTDQPQLQVPQHSEEWYEIKRKLIGANDYACLLGLGYNSRWETILSKIFYTEIAVTEETLKRMERGTRLEPFVKKSYEERNSINIIETGLLVHPQFSFLCASPDGIIDDNTLVEFKVLSEIDSDNGVGSGSKSGCVPMKYWIQMQIQEQVFNKSRCIYCPNVIEEDDVYTSKIKNYLELEVLRDDPWFNSTILGVSQDWDKIEQCRKNPELISVLFGEEQKFHNLLTHSCLDNWFNDDPLLDWLDKWGQSRGIKSSSASSSSSSSSSSMFDMGKWVYRQSIIFRKHCLKYIQSGINITYAMSDDTDVKYYPAKLKTQELMAQNTEAIANALVCDDQFCCKVDLLLRKDLLKKLFKVDADKMPKTSSNYVPILFKYATHQLLVDKLHLASNPRQNKYKMQMHLICKCIGSSAGYIADRKFNIAEVKIESGKAIADKIANGLRWLAEVSEDSAKSWDIFNPHRTELRPNMKNKYDDKWKHFKQQLAVQQKDITLMYMCGKRARDELLSEGVNTWDDIPKDKFQGFIEANTKNKNIRLDVNNAIIKSDINCFYVDFETASDLYDDFSKFPDTNAYSVIYLIGCLDRYGNYKHYIADRLNLESEATIIHQWIDDMLATANAAQDITIFHWGNAEHQHLKHAFETNSLIKDKHKFDKFSTVDLCDLFRKSKIHISGCFGYGLKDIGKNLFNQKLITHSWNDDIDGTQAMVAAWLAERECRNKATIKRLVDTTLFDFRKIIEYNKNDCLVTADVAKLLMDKQNQQ